MSWQFVDNLAYRGMSPRALEAMCHDRSPFITVRCPACGSENHVHETQLLGTPGDAEMVMRCAHCRLSQLTTTVQFFRDGFAELRRAGWIA